MWEYLGIVTFRLSMVGWCLCLLSMVTMFFYAIRMSAEIREDAKNRYGPRFPIFVRREDLIDDKGWRSYQLYHRWMIGLLISFLLTGAMMYIHHRYWP